MKAGDISFSLSVVGNITLTSHNITTFKKIHKSLIKVKGSIHLPVECDGIKEGWADLMLIQELRRIRSSAPWVRCLNKALKDQTVPKERYRDAVENLIMNGYESLI